MTLSMDSPPTPCASCGALLAGPYCSACGEELLKPEQRTLRYFFGNVVASEMFDVDGRIWRTFKLLLVRPAFLAAEFITGRRRPYINSPRILIITIIVFTLTMTGTNFSLAIPFGDFRLSLNMIPSPIQPSNSVEGVLFRTDPYGVVANMLETKTRVPIAELSEDDGIRFIETLDSLATPLSFTVVLLLALLLFLLFNRKRSLFVDHLVFAMNYYSFLLITAMLASAAFAIARLLGLGFVLFLLFAVQLWQIAYLTIAVRRFYLPATHGLLAWPGSTTVALLLFVFGGIFITGVQLLSGAVAVWLL